MTERVDMLSDRITGLRSTTLPRLAYVPPAPPPTGEGYIAGTNPAGLVTVDGVPSKGTVRVLLRRSGWVNDGYIVAEVESGQDGTYRVDGLNPDLRYDVVGRKEGYADVIVSNVKPKI